MRKNLIARMIIAAVVVFGVVMPSFADSSIGNGLHRDRVAAYGTDIYHIVFRADEVATVGISGDHSTNINLYIYDDNGNLVARDDNGYGDERFVKMMVYRTSRFTIKVVNRGNVYNDYEIGHN